MKEADLLKQEEFHLTVVKANEIKESGFKTMFTDVVYKALNGVTDIDEVIKAVS